MTKCVDQIAEERNQIVNPNIASRLQLIKSSPYADYNERAFWMVRCMNVILNLEKKYRKMSWTANAKYSLFELMKDQCIDQDSKA